MRRSTRDMTILFIGFLVFGPTLLTMAAGSFDQMRTIVTPYVLPVLGVLLVLAVVRALLSDRH